MFCGKLDTRAIFTSNASVSRVNAVCGQVIRKPIIKPPNVRFVIYERDMATDLYLSPVKSVGAQCRGHSLAYSAISFTTLQFASQDDKTRSLAQCHAELESIADPILLSD